MYLRFCPSGFYLLLSIYFWILYYFLFRVIDTDGEFLLIEAADFLPLWADPETCGQRVSNILSWNLVCVQIQGTTFHYFVLLGLSLSGRSSFHSSCKHRRHRRWTKKLDFCARRCSPYKIITKKHTCSTAYSKCYQGKNWGVCTVTLLGALCGENLSVYFYCFSFFADIQTK